MIILGTREKILSQAIISFAEKGYSGLSMRQLAQAVDMSVAAIYHHFPDKNTLYLEAIHFTFSSKEPIFASVWQSDDSAEQKLQRFVRALLDVLIHDHDFHNLMQREIMEANPERMQLLAHNVFQDQFCLLMQLAAELAPTQDAYLVAVSIISVVEGTIKCQPLHKHFSGWQPEHQQPDIIAAHITALLLNGLKAQRT